MNDKTDPLLMKREYLFCKQMQSRGHLPKLSLVSGNRKKFIAIILNLKKKKISLCVSMHILDCDLENKLQQ